VSETVSSVYVAPGDTDYRDATWRLKNRIHEADGVLDQSAHFFRFQYQRCGVYLRLRDDAPIGFGVVRADGYLSLLGVHPDHRRRGIGKRIVDRIADDHDRISCHTRADNHSAVGFYTDLGFVVTDRVDGYYRDGTDAYRLELDDPTALDRILDVLDG